MVSAIATALDIPGRVLAATLGVTALPPARISVTADRRGEEALLRRREFLQSTAALAIESTIYRPPGVTRPTDVVTRELALAQADYRESRYALLGQRLPSLLDHAQSSGDTVTEAAAFNLATAHLIKLGADDMTLITTDRARTAAHASGDPLAMADSAFSLCVALRHAGRAHTAYTVVQEAAEHLDAETRLATDLEKATYGQLFLTAAYTAARVGDADLARDYLSQAQEVAATFEQEYRHGLWFFGQSMVNLYGISVAGSLGDTGRALQHARQVRPASLPTSERAARYWIDLARIFARDNDKPRARTALTHIRKVAPEETKRDRFMDLANRVGFATQGGSGR
jgi:tetratricopeptide (TPR) repeat protein